jgi:CYTH domain-containing protein
MGDQPKYSRVEMERRWIADLEAIGSLEKLPFREIDDLYITGTRLRVRKVTGDADPVIYKLGMKYGKKSGFSEPITSIYLKAHEYAVVSKLPGRRVHKMRYLIEGGLLDVYEAPHAGLAIFEVEFDDDASARAYRPPAFAGREVTDEAGYSGASLAD